MRARSALPALLPLLGSLVILGGCTAAPPVEVTVTSPVPLPSASPTVETTPTRVATPAAVTPPPIPVPSPPAEMARDDEVGAIAAAVYFMTDLYPYMVETLDTLSWKDMSTPECSFCLGMIEQTTHREAAETASLAPIRHSQSRAERVEDQLFYVTFRVEKGPDNYYGPDGGLVDSVPRTTGFAELNLLRAQSHWRVSAVKLTQDAETSP